MCIRDRCSLIHARTHGEDGIYSTYEESDPIAFNPFYVEDGVFDIEKKESIKTLIPVSYTHLRPCKYANTR